MAAPDGAPKPFRRRWKVVSDAFVWNYFSTLKADSLSGQQFFVYGDVPGWRNL